jgi:predicted transcriptional regulator
MQITIQIPDDLQQKLTERASQLDIPLETLILESLADLAEPADPDNTPKAFVIESLRVSLEAVKAGKVHPIEELWDGIDE